MAQVDESVTAAGWAPFHYAAHAVHRRGDLGAIVPWRMYVLDDPACRGLLAFLDAQEDVEPWTSARTSKIPRMLAAAGALVLVTWLPDPPPPAAEPSRALVIDDRNAEHLAAASAATQNLLLAATARGLASYWSSGGMLRERALLDRCGVAPGQPLLAAVFLFPEPSEGDEFVTGKLREKRGAREGWVTRVRL